MIWGMAPSPMFSEGALEIFADREKLAGRFNPKKPEKIHELVTRRTFFGTTRTYLRLLPRTHSLKSRSCWPRGMMSRFFGPWFPVLSMQTSKTIYSVTATSVG